MIDIFHFELVGCFWFWRSSPIGQSSPSLSKLKSSNSTPFGFSGNNIPICARELYIIISWRKHEHIILNFATPATISIKMRPWFSPIWFSAKSTFSRIHFMSNCFLVFVSATARKNSTWLNLQVANWSRIHWRNCEHRTKCKTAKQIITNESAISSLPVFFCSNITGFNAPMASHICSASWCAWNASFAKPIWNRIPNMLHGARISTYTNHCNFMVHVYR